MGHLYSKAIFFKYIVYRSLLVHRKKTCAGITVPYPIHRVAIKCNRVAVIVYPVEDGGELAVGGHRSGFLKYI